MPVRAPLIVVKRLQHRVPNSGERLMTREENAAKEPEMMVLTMDRLTAAPSPLLLMASWEPPLKAKKPKKRIKPPSAATCRQGASIKPGVLPCVLIFQQFGDLV